MRWCPQEQEKVTHEPGPGCGGWRRRGQGVARHSRHPGTSTRCNGGQMTGTPPPPPQAVLASRTISEFLSNDICYLTIIVIVIAFKILKF